MKPELVTFVAAPSVKDAPPEPTLQEIVKTVRDFGDVVPVARLVDIAKYLQEREDDPPATIQITGHARPGVIALGYFWDGEIRRDGFHQLLDSSPYAYGELWGRIQPPTRVVLAGCLAGADGPEPTVAGGSTLVFDLHKMWECDVFAADVMVSSADFKQGYYVGSAYGLTRDGWCRVHGLTHFDPPIVNGSRPTFSDVRITGVPMLDFKPLDIPNPQLLDGYSEEIQLGERPLALDEVQLTGKLDSDDAKFALMAGGQLLEARIGNESGNECRRFFRAPITPKAHVERRSPAAKVWRTLRDELRKQKVVG